MNLSKINTELDAFDDKGGVTVKIDFIQIIKASIPLLIAILEFVIRFLTFRESRKRKLKNIIIALQIFQITNIKTD